MSFGHWLCTHKFLLFLVASTTAFCLATIILSVDNAELRDKIDDFEKNATVTVPTTTTTRTTTITKTTPVATTSTTTTTTVIPVETTTSTAKTTFESTTITSSLTTPISPITTVPPDETTTIIPVTSTTDEPSTTTTEEIPTSTTEEITTIEQSTTSEVPLTSTSEESTTSEVPLTSTTEESTTSEVPSRSTTEEPTTTAAEEIPTSTTEEITTTEESTTSEVPSTSTAEESTTELTTSTTEELTTTTQEITTSTTEQSTTIEDSTISPPTTTEDPDSDNMWVLPKATRPVAYELTLLPHLGSGLFDGKVKIQVDVAESIESISLHSHLLEILSVTVDGVDANFELNEDYQLLVITKQDETRFDAGRRVLEISYSGDMKNRMVGLYTSSYLNDDGDTTVIATSKFEPTYARQAFPCFDEPNKKATYVVKLLKPKATEYIALSNYPVETTEEYDADNELVTFNETVPMSTYLTCFIVSDFTATETTFNNGEGKDPIPLKVYASPGQLSKTQYAGEIGKAAIEYYVKYFDIPYPLPKLDMVAIPDFVSGAMEHWGLVTYRETALLYTAETHSSSNKQRVATVVAHELAHSWFGNLVTMNWWNDLWLNEGFATYIEYKGVNAHHPDWDMMTQFLTADLHPVLSFDAEESSYPIVAEVKTPDEITSVFNTIAYNKGASILRMLEDTVGEENFRTGVTDYLIAYEYGNAITENFLEKVQAVVGDEVDITEMMDTYTTQKGYPVVSVKADEGATIWTLTQKRFSKGTSSDSDANQYNYKWTIPITWRALDGTTTTTGKIMFKYSDASAIVDVPSSATYVKLNNDQVGYYRVHYPNWVYSRLVANYETLTVADRTNIIEEWFALADAGLISSFNVPLGLTKKLVSETDYTPWSAAATVFLKLKIRMREDSGTTHVDNLKAYLKSLIQKPYEAFTWTESADDSHLRRLTRNVVVQLACEAELEACTQEAQNLFNGWIESNTPLSQDLRSIIYKYGIKKADEDSWNIVFDRFKAEQDANEKLKLMNGLANIENTDILARFIEESKDTNIVRTQDFLTLLQYVSGNEYGTSLVWDWVRENWNFLEGRYGLNDRNLGSLIPSITSSFASSDRVDEMNAFFAEYPEAGAGATNRQKALEAVQSNLIWNIQYRDSISSWFSSNTPVD